MSNSRTLVLRREFLIQGSAATLGLAVSPLLASALLPAKVTQRKVLHVIGHSHIDAAWLWPWRDGSDAVLNTFRSALNRMNENPQFCYSHSSSMHYRWAQQADPQMFAEIKARVRQGRWEVVGGWPVEPDCNIPATESFVRHSLYGKEFCRQALGADVKIGFNPDSFGHAAGLPLILNRAGYDYYVFMRPQEQEMDLPLLFFWESEDGSRVLALRIYKEYDGKAANIPSATQKDFAPGIDHAVFFLGVGDHGGAVTAEQVRAVVKMQSDPTLPEIRFSTLQSFFSEVANSPGFASLPVIKRDLQHHSRGCYSADGAVKALNRRAERWMVESETISLIATRVADQPYPGEEYAASWWKILFCQFHDMLAGTALYSDYENVRDSVGYACEVALASRVSALERMAKQVDTNSVKESAAFLFNPLPWRRAALVEIYAEADPEQQGEITHLTGQDGTTVPIQWRPSDSMTNFLPRLSAWVELPPLGYKVMELAHGPAPPGLPFSDRFAVSETGFGLGSFKAEDGAELLARNVGLVVLSDTADTWAHDVKQFRQEMGRPMLVSAEVVEDGPVTRVTRHRATWMDSEITLDIAQFAGIDAVEFRFVIDWRQHQQMMKLEIPTALAEPRLFAKVPGEVLERSVNGEEEPYQDWAAVQGQISSRPYTVALINAQTYSYDCLGGLFRTVLIRSAPYARHRPWPVTYNDTHAWQDQGRQERRFWIVGGKGNWQELDLDRRAEEFQTPAEYVMDSAHAGHQPWTRSFLEVTPGNIWTLALKRAENADNGTILRLQERSGAATKASLKSTLLGVDQFINFAPWELKTFLIVPSSGGRATAKEVSLLER
jgi:alpha-mannosidase